MEPDLIERLRDMHDGIPTTYVGKLRAEAAAEIERLRAALEECADRLERCAIAMGNDRHVAASAVVRYRKLLTK